jgi:CubicO group peptidase (beta-lactamase class C family)
MSVIKEGIDTERLDRVGARLRSDVDTGCIHGASMIVSRRGEVIIDVVEGYADKAAGRPLERDSVFAIMSTSKPMTNVLALSLVEQGKLRLHAPVADVIPEFAHLGKGTVNLFHLMTHTSGTTKGIPPMDLATDIEKVTGFACSVPPDSPPGDRVDYSLMIAHSVIGAMCVRADGGGRSFSTMLDEDLFQPLGMSDTHLGPRDDLMARLCPVTLAERLPESLPVDEYAKLMLRDGAEIPGTNVLSTIDDLHRFTEMLSRGGELDGVRILSPATIKYCARIHTGALVDAGMSGYRTARGWQEYPANIGVGFRVRGDNFAPGPFGLLNSPATFGHFGSGSTGIWVDPEHELAYSFLSTGLQEDTRHMERTALLSDLVTNALVA